MPVDARVICGHVPAPTLVLLHHMYACAGWRSSVRVGGGREEGASFASQRMDPGQSASCVSPCLLTPKQKAAACSHPQHMTLWRHRTHMPDSPGTYAVPFFGAGTSLKTSFNHRPQVHDKTFARWPQHNPAIPAYACATMGCEYSAPLDVGAPPVHKEQNSVSNCLFASIAPVLYLSPCIYL